VKQEARTERDSGDKAEEQLSRAYRIYSELYKVSPAPVIARHKNTDAKLFNEPSNPYDRQNQSKRSEQYIG
jgi:hypothetical protein